MENSMVCLPGLRPTANWGWPLVLVIRINCHLFWVGRLLRNVVTKLNCSGSPWLNTRLENSFKFNSQKYCIYLLGWHDEVCRGVNSVGSLHPVWSSDSGDSRISVKIDVELELSDEVKGLKIIIPRLVISAGILDWLNYNYEPNRKLLLD